MMDPIEATSMKVDYGTPIKRHQKRKIQRPAGYFSKEVDLQKTPILFFPPGKEMLFLGIYFAILPYITGLLFMFFVVAKGNPALFTSLKATDSFIMVWAIGYEILAAIIILWIIKNAIAYSLKASRAEGSRSRRRRKRRHP